MNLNNLKTSVVALFMAFGMTAKSDVTLAWNPVPDATITNYMLYWGTSSGVYTYGASAGLTTNYTVTGLSNGVYYFAVVAVGQNGTQSLDSNEAIYTNNAITPPIPPGGGGGGNGGGNGGSGNSGGSGNAGGGSGGSGSGGSGSTIASSLVGTTNASGEVSVPGIPPALGLSINSVQHPVINISGTLGATFDIYSSTNPASLASWNIFTNQTMTNGITNQASTSVVNLAFTPAAQTYEVIDSAPPTGEFYKVAMPYDYMVLADANLSGQGVVSRLLLVRMPGVTGDDVCYVTNQSSFIFYDTTNNAFALEPSGATIRQIATTLATSLGQNWTSASEFNYSNGVSTILATVVFTDPPSSDPVVGQTSTPSIQIDF